jgi:hypothetical protein
MKKIAWAGIAMIALAAYAVVAAERQDRPAGVSDRDWVQISERFGFVVDEQSVWPSATSSPQILIAPPDLISAEHMPPAKGYFVVKTPLGWRRVVIADYYATLSPASSR